MRGGIDKVTYSIAKIQISDVNQSLKSVIANHIIQAMIMIGVVK